MASNRPVNWTSHAETTDALSTTSTPFTIGHPQAWIADCWVCDEYGRIDPGLNVSPIPDRHEDLGSIVNVVTQD